MVVSLFGVLMLPVVEDRRKLQDALEVMHKYLKVYGCFSDQISRPLYGTFWNIEEGEWLMKFSD